MGTRVVPVSEAPFVKAVRKQIARLPPPPASPLKAVRLNRVPNNTKETVYTIDRQPSQNDRAKKQNCNVNYGSILAVKSDQLKSSPSAEVLLKRPGSYKPFWMKDDNANKSDSAKKAVADKREEIDKLLKYHKEMEKGSTKKMNDNNNRELNKGSGDSDNFLAGERSDGSSDRASLGSKNSEQFWDMSNSTKVSDGIKSSNTSNVLNKIANVTGKSVSSYDLQPEGSNKRLTENNNILESVNPKKTHNPVANVTINKLADSFGSDINLNDKQVYKKRNWLPMYAKNVSNAVNKFRDVSGGFTIGPDGEKLEKIFRADGQRVYRLGEKGSVYTSTNRPEVQDFHSLRSQCLNNGRLFEDPEFLPNDASLYFSQRPDRRFEWLRPSEIAENPQLFVEGFSRFDVQQGELGDCWLLAAVANLTLHRKLFFQIVPDDQSFDEEYAGIFHFRFWQYGRWVDVVIDDRLPTHRGKLVFLHSNENNEFWSALLEKAYAKLHGSYEALKGGSTCEAMEDFTGGVTEMYEMTEVPPNLYTILMHGYQRSSLMGCSIEPDPNILEAETDQGLVRGHAYSITRVTYVEIETPGRQGKIPLLRLRNPWGNYVEWKGPWSDKSPEWRYIPEAEKEEIGLTFDEDGEFWMSYKDFLTQFTRLEICNLNPDSLDPDETPEGCNKKWEMSVFEGEWVRGVTAGGCRNYLDSFWQNPQYNLTLTDPDEDDEQNLCTVIVALMQKNRRSQRSAGLDCLTIGFAIYKQTQSGQRPLQLDFFKYNASVARSPSFINLREVSCRFKLPPGTYCIVPSTFEPNEEGEFLLRVFTETSSYVTENDEQNGMGEVDDRVKDVIPEMPPTPDDPVRQFFLKLAGADGEVDWLELKEILDYSMRNELGPAGGGAVPGGGPGAGGGPPQERGFLEQLACSLCAPICKEFGIDLEQVAGGGGQQGPEGVHLNQPETRGQGFSKEVCRSMVAMLDSDGSGKLGFEEFKSLWVDIRQWKAVFKLYDPNGTGRIPAASLRDALHSAGYTLNNHILNILAHRYGSRDGYIAFDDFIMCSVRLKTMIARNEPLENLEREMPLFNS